MIPRVQTAAAPNRNLFTFVKEFRCAVESNLYLTNQKSDISLCKSWTHCVLLHRSACRFWEYSSKPFGRLSMSSIDRTAYMELRRLRQGLLVCVCIPALEGERTERPESWTGRCDRRCLTIAWYGDRYECDGFSIRVRLTSILRERNVKSTALLSSESPRVGG